MSVVRKFILCSLLAPACLASAENVLRSAAELTEYIEGTPTSPALFSLTATVTHANSSSEFFFVKDASGASTLVNPHLDILHAGDIISASGRISFCPVGNAKTDSNSFVKVIGHVAAPPPLRLPIAKLSTRHNYQLVQTEGVIVDVFRDEIDDEDFFMLIADGGHKIPVLIPGPYSLDAIRFLDTKVSVLGILHNRSHAYRTYSGPHISLDGYPIILSQPSESPFNAPPLAFHPILSPAEISNLSRRSVRGHVLAAWEPDNILVLTDDKKPILIQLFALTPLPRYGSYIKAVGYPTTDLFHINLARAIYRTEKPTYSFEPSPVTDINPSEIMIDTDRPTGHALRFIHGQTLKLTGIVQNSPGMASNSKSLHLECGNVLVTVKSGTSGVDLAAYADGCCIQVTGACILESDSWTSDKPLPSLHGMTLVLRQTGDLSVISYPPWWTPKRLAIAISILLLSLLAFTLWNRHLNRLVNRRGHELAREKIKKESAQLKIDERTRLAVELHDSLSQNLEGVACQVVASRNTLKASPSAAADCLSTAEKMLDSCRTELRRCLFDLRGHALEEKNLADALRATLAPLCEDVDLGIRFDVRRANFDDTTVHAILCMVRELVSNALRHGRATQVRVAGEYHDGMLNFSVRDNGCGFDTGSRPGPVQGHFGLEGIRERAERFNGSVKIESVSGQGTRIAVMLQLGQLRASS